LTLGKSSALRVWVVGVVSSAAGPDFSQRKAAMQASAARVIALVFASRRKRS